MAKSSKICRVGYQGGGSSIQGALETWVWGKECTDLWILICVSLRGNYQSWAKTYCEELHDHSLTLRPAEGGSCPHREGRHTVHGISVDASEGYHLQSGQVSPLKVLLDFNEQSLKGTLKSTQLISIIEICTEIESNTKYKTSSSNQETKGQNRCTIKKFIFMQRRRKNITIVKRKIIIPDTGVTDMKKRQEYVTNLFPTFRLWRRPQPWQCGKLATQTRRKRIYREKYSI